MEVIEANLATGMGNVRKILEVAIPEVKGVGGECLFMRRLVSEKVHCSAISRRSC